MRRVLRAVLTLSSLLGAALSPSCFDAPIRQGLRIFFNADGTVEVHAATTIRKDWSDTDQAGVRKRLEQVRDAILHGEDRWSRAFRAMEPQRERVTLDYEEGLLIGAARQAVMDDPRSVEKLFSETAVAAAVEREDDVWTLELVPGGSGDATQRQRRQVEESLEWFSAAVAEYAETLADLYRWLDEHPDHAPEAMGTLLGVSGPFEENLTADRPPGAPDGTSEGRTLLKRAEKAGEKLSGLLVIESQEAYTPDELSRLVYDPFPSPLDVEVEGEILEVAGFLEAGGRRFATRSHSLWDALDSLRGRWVEPVPMVEAVAAFRGVEDDEELDEEKLLRDVLSIPRTVHLVPAAGEVKAALVTELTPPDLYRLRWRLPVEP